MTLPGRLLMPDKQESTWTSFDHTSWAQQRLEGKYNINYKKDCPANDVNCIFPDVVESHFVDSVRSLSTFREVEQPANARADDAPRAYAAGDASVKPGELMVVFAGDGGLLDVVFEPCADVQPPPGAECMRVPCGYADAVAAAAAADAAAADAAAAAADAVAAATAASGATPPTPAPAAMPGAGTISAQLIATASNAAQRVMDVMLATAKKHSCAAAGAAADAADAAAAAAAGTAASGSAPVVAAAAPCTGAVAHAGAPAVTEMQIAELNAKLRDAVVGTLLACSSASTRRTGAFYALRSGFFPYVPFCLRVCSCVLGQALMYFMAGCTAIMKNWRRAGSGGLRWFPILRRCRCWAAVTRRVCVLCFVRSALLCACTC
jgi:hypothetical protein